MPIELVVPMPLLLMLLYKLKYKNLTLTPGLRYENITLNREDFGKNDPDRTGTRSYLTEKIK